MAMSARGQGTVELALGAVVVVSTVLLSVYLAEVGFLSLKVQEAANFAALESTGARVHDFSEPMAGGHYQPLLGLGATLSSAASRRYRDFDGATRSGGPRSVGQVFARADNLSVACQQTGGNGPQFRFPGGGGSSGRLLGGWYQNRGGISCSAQARLSALPRLPSHYLDGADGQHHEQLQTFAPMTVCGAGRAVGGNCRGRYSVLLGDWSLDGPRRSALSADAPFARPQPNTYEWYDGRVEKQLFEPDNMDETRNRPYRQLARELFRRSGENYNAGVPGTPPSMAFALSMEPLRRVEMSDYLYNERQPDGDPDGRGQMGEDFAFSYAGPERGSKDVFETSCPPCHFNTNGTATVDGPLEHRELPLRKRWNADVRKDCFLGLDGCAAAP